MENATSPDLSDPHDKPRRKLVQAAAEVFAEVGYNSATVREICVRAGVNVAAVNYHFRDKLGLFKATLQFAMASEGTPGPVEDLTFLPPEEALRAYLLRSFVHFGQTDHPAMYTRMMLQETAVPSDGLRTIVANVTGPRVMILAKIVGRLLGLPPTHKKTRLAVHSILGQVFHYVQARPLLTALWPDWKIDSAQMEEILNHIADFSLAALRAIKESGPHTD